MNGLRREEVLNRTWRNPRYYTVFLLLPIVCLPVAIVCAMAPLGRAIETCGETLDYALERAFAPYRRWVDRGKRNIPEPPK